MMSLRGPGGERCVQRDLSRSRSKSEFQLQQIDKGEDMNKKGLAARIAAAAITVSAATVGAIAATSTDANAAALGCATFGTVQVAGYTIPGGLYCFGVYGSGLTITGTDSSAQTVRIYNESEIIRVYDGNGSLRSTVTTISRTGATYGQQSWSTGYRPTIYNGGKICGSLRSSGTVIATVCHNTFK